MKSVATWFLMGQSLEVVQTRLGPFLKHQYHADKQTDFYLHSTEYLEGVFAIAIAGIISVFRQDHCVALRIIFDQQDPGYEQFRYTSEVAGKLFGRVVAPASVDWQPLETEARGDRQHHVYCLGQNIATTWDTAVETGTLAGDIIVYFERRCGTPESIGGPSPSLGTATAPAASTEGAAIAVAPQTVTSSSLKVSKTFPDIAGNPYAAEIIKAANDYGIVSGYDDGKFHPTADLTRAQAVTLLINAMQYRLPPEAIQIPATLSDPPPFADVTAGAAATKIQFAKEANLISGDGSGLFRPLDKLGRAALIAMIHKGLSYIIRHERGTEVALKEAIAPIADPPEPFPDVKPNHWAASLIADLLPTGIVSADLSDARGDRFNPDKPAQRDYAAAAMVRLVETQLLDAPEITPDHPLHDPDPVPEVTFSDIAGNRYEPQITIAANQYGIVKGFSDGTFRPTAPVSREQAVSMLIDALRERIIYESAVDIPITVTEPPFADVPVDRWSAPKIHFAKQAGIIAGDASGRFFPEASIGRAQLMAIAYQALSFGVWQDFGRQMALDQIFNTDVVETSNFVDIPNDYWAASMMLVMSVLGLAQPQSLDKPEQFAPNAIAQRDYTVATAVHMVQLMYTDMPTPIEPGA